MVKNNQSKAAKNQFSKPLKKANAISKESLSTLSSYRLKKYSKD